MPSAQQSPVDRGVASRALISLIADLTWAERRRANAPTIQRIREEALALLTKIDQGDGEATRRAMELVNARGARAA
jgi:hypothetical protein